ncbi:hypothetical protein A2763_03120 [Candidatus Kaiserbacteria bacterium RIFCSPHIGHO2_01_FULL_54_36]|uniref:Bacterial spore germination immunoglobulin-like domain-containing protein n=1 Tax=Candidatus Kaiserbacteria bacterium RIFCSPHIGHO2_01_FULL_54_36 TaxID=1798482 RepID=A0A1F6CK71_9BACT|nr:MAG: hypothetical protein A2763_03120 [Candidatus Kaiserbacteria bacterium RIFCSPHIGHO2_01_FULL_54_36]OGG75390.1 MAG: hypothetical protein A3A41_02375 [Candidatus Kaiserbacteria bacterium RIFCSPLOWO2_01_FULL_54_22]
MSTRGWWGIILLLTAVIIALAWVLFAVPSPVEAPTATSTSPTTTPDPDQPLSARVIVTSPKANATVGKTLVVSGSAPGPWFFEASFPIKIVDGDNDFIGNGIAQAQGEWMTTEQVTFTSVITIENYSGPATVVLLRDNPSGMPENDDSVSIPIVIQ